MVKTSLGAQPSARDQATPPTPQWDWLREDLYNTTKPLKYVFSHVGSGAPCYSLSTGLDPYGCGCWGEHQAYQATDPAPFHTMELARVLSDYNVTAIYRGHDHSPSRDLVDANNQEVFKRSCLDVYMNPHRPTAPQRIGSHLKCREEFGRWAMAPCTTKPGSVPVPATQWFKRKPQRSRGLSA